MLLILGLAVARPILWLGTLAAILFAAFRLIQTLAGERIDKVVKGDSGLLPASLNSQPGAPPVALALSTVPGPERPADSLARGATVGAAQVILETITPDAIPATSVSGQANRCDPAARSGHSERLPKGRHLPCDSHNGPACRLLAG
jgi:hypothetical protein